MEKGPRRPGGPSKTRGLVATRSLGFAVLPHHEEQADKQDPGGAENQVVRGHWNLPLAAVIRAVNLRKILKSLKTLQSQKHLNKTH